MMIRLMIITNVCFSSLLIKYEAEITPFILGAASIENVVKDVKDRSNQMQVQGDVQVKALNTNTGNCDKAKAKAS